MITFEEIKEILAEVMELEKAEVVEELQLDPEDNWDSIVVVSLIAELDEKFDVMVDGTKLADCKSVKELLELINL